MAKRPNRLRSSRRALRLDFGAIEIIGGLLTPDTVARVAAFDAQGQDDESYSVPPGLKVRDEIARYFRIGEALWAKFEIARAASPAASEKFALDLLRQCFGFDAIKSQATIRKGEREFPVRHTAFAGRIPIVIAPVPQATLRRSGLDESLAHFGDGARRRSATLLLQEYLNAEEDCVWGLALDGLTLRLMRDNVSLTRPAWIEADLQKIFSEGLFPDFSALWLLIHQSRFGKSGAPPSESSLELWRDTGRIEGVAARERLREGVESALIELGQGFIEHAANGALRQALTDGKLSRQTYFEELLRLVYRLIFLFAAEDRELLHAPATPQSATKTYSDGYSLARLRERCMRRTAWDRHGDAWEGLKATFSALGKGEPLLGLPALGGLFAEGQLPNLSTCKLDNRRLLAAIWRLAWMRPDGHPLTRVNWRDMETEELGSVYESLLELTPIASADTRSFAFAEGDETRGNARKTSGSYYTPDSLVQALLDESLTPLIEETIAGKEDQVAIEALLELRIIDPACGSGHFLLAAARRLASRIARLSSPGTPSEADYRHWLREVARRCLFGVDRNPMAIELAKVALWIETVEPGKPLSFLDAHLRCGDALLGVYDLKALQIGIPDDAYKALTGDDKKAASAWKARNKAERDGRKQGELSFFEPPKALLESARAIEALAEDDLQSVQKKAEAYRKLFAGEDRHRMEAACDLYIAAFLMPKTEPPVRTVGGAGAFIPTSRDVWDKLAGTRPLGLIETGAVAVAKAGRAFHWPLEFPQVFFPGAGRTAGFDLALGNPPWERIKLQEQEFFASRDPTIARASNAAARRRLIENIAAASEGSAERALYLEFVIAKRLAEASSIFARVSAEEGGRYPLTGAGDVNTYALFAELFNSIAIRVGVILPTGIATDSTTAPFFAHLVAQQRLSSFFDFENRERLFPGIYFRVRFCLLVLQSASQVVKFSCLLTQPNQSNDKKRRFTLTPAEIATINPNTKTAPVFRSSADAELTKAVYSRSPVLVDLEKGNRGNPWNLTFHTRIWHMAEDAEWFRSASQLSADGFVREGRVWVNGKKNIRYLPLYEAKMIHHYNHRYGDFLHAEEKEDADYREIPQADATLLSDPSYDPTVRYWVPEDEVKVRLDQKGWSRGWLIGWRDITNATNQRTVISSIIPRSASGDKFLLMFPGVDCLRISALLATMSSLSFDYVARQKLGGTSLKLYLMQQLPTPQLERYSPKELGFIASRVLELCYTSHSMKAFADDLGYSRSTPFAWNENRRALLRAELDAKIAQLYGLTRDQLRYILDPADVYGADYPSETFRVLKNNEIAKYGEYRTAKLVLQAFDHLTAGTLSTEVVRLDSSRPEVRTQQPKHSALVDGAWSRPRTNARGEIGAALIALLKRMQSPMPVRQVRLAAILALEPRLLVPMLDKKQAAEWRRLVGTDADPLPKGAVQFIPSADQNWGHAVRGLSTRENVVEDTKAGTWAPGTGLDKFETGGWPEGRASFVLDVLSAIGDQPVIDKLPEAVRRWVDAEAA